MKNVLKIVFMVLLIQSCKQNQKIVEGESIMRLLYNYESTKIPPPSLEALNSGKIKKITINSKYIDSVKYAINRVCIADDLTDLNPSKIPAGYKDLVLSYNKGESLCLLPNPNLKDNEGHVPPSVPHDFSREALNQIKTKYGVLGIVSYSPIVINKDKAILLFGAIREGLDSYSAVFFLKKENGQWKILSKTILSMS